MLRKPLTGRLGASEGWVSGSPAKDEPFVPVGGDRSGSVSSAAGSRGSGGHALHAGSEGVKVGRVGDPGQGG